MNLGLSISTYFIDDYPERFETFKTCINSLKNTNYDGIIEVVDDCSNSKKHLEWLNNTYQDITIIERNKNGGTSAVKNAGIKSLLNKNIEFGFLIDDDILFKDKDWFKYYYDAYKKTNIHHFSFFQYKKTNINYKRTIKIINNIKLSYTSSVHGAFLTFTPEMINKMGYFKILKYKYGGGHVNFSIRAKKFGFCEEFTDLENALDLLDLLSSPTSLKFKDMKKIHENLKYHTKYLNYVEYVD